MTNALEPQAHRPVRAAGLARRAAMLLAGAGLLTIAACSDEGDAASSVVEPAATAATTDAAAAGSTSASDAAADSTGASETASAEPSLTPSAEAPEPDGSVDVAALMSDQALPDIVIGDENAPVTIVEYASMTCGHCAAFHENSLPAIKANYLDTGKAKLIVREFPFDPLATAAFMLARCAGENDSSRRTAMVDVLFDQQAAWARAEKPSEALLQIARLSGMSQERFVACLNDRDLQGKIVAEQQRAEKEFGVSATPTFFINGEKYAGAMRPEDMAAVIEAANAG